MAGPAARGAGRSGRNIRALGPGPDPPLWQFCHEFGQFGRFVWSVRCIPLGKCPRLWRIGHSGHVKGDRSVKIPENGRARALTATLLAGCSLAVVTPAMAQGEDAEDR